MKWRADRPSLSRVVQSGLPTRKTPPRYATANGLLLRGVVTATYVVDDPQHPELDDAAGVQPVAVYSDVLVYSSMPGMRFMFLPRVLVSQDRGDLHSGKVWKPRAAKIDKTDPTGGWDIDGPTNPANLDGSHVLVGFIDDNLNFPVILKGIPHPSTDVGNEEEAKPGHRLRLKLADGDPDLWKHKGSFYGIDGSGDFVVDTTQGYAGEDLETDASEPAAPGDGSAGNHRVRLQAGATLTVDIDGGPTLVLSEKNTTAILTLGDGAVAVAVADHLETLYGNLKSYVENAKVNTGVGPSSTISSASGPAPSWDSNINSNKLTIPDT